MDTTLHGLLIVACCRINMGTADELAMDVLINALSTLSKEYVYPLHVLLMQGLSSVRQVALKATVNLHRAGTSA